MHRKKAVLIYLLMSTTGCGSGAADIVGVWEIRYLDAVGQSYLDVMELRADGTYTTHMQGSAPSDSGQYTVVDHVIAFRSALDPLFSNDIPFDFDGDDVLRLTLPAPPGATPAVADWRRSPLQRQFGIQDESGRRVPMNLLNQVRSLTGDTQIWRPDAVPTWVRLEAQQNGDYITTVHLFSATASEELRVRIAPFDATVSTHDGSRTAQKPLPTSFLDLLPILEMSGTEIQRGTLETADLSVWGEHGAVWRLNDGRQVVSLSAESGDVIQGDVTGYKEQYEADWNRAQESWREILAPEAEPELLYCYQAKTEQQG